MSGYEICKPGINIEYSEPIDQNYWIKSLYASCLAMIFGRLCINIEYSEPIDQNYWIKSCVRLMSGYEIWKPGINIEYSWANWPKLWNKILPMHHVWLWDLEAWHKYWIFWANWPKLLNKILACLMFGYEICKPGINIEYSEPIDQNYWIKSFFGSCLAMRFGSLA